MPKPNNNINVCVDLTKINSDVCSERHTLPSVKQIFTQIGESTIFSKLNTNVGFWQIELLKQSALLTAFISQYGRCWLNQQLSFGITSGPEYFPETNVQYPNWPWARWSCLYMIDNVLVHGITQQEHDQRLLTVLDRLCKPKSH